MKSKENDLNDLNDLNEIIEQMKQMNLIDLNDIPEIDLYMDQITTFMDEQLMPFKRNEKDKILTKTMINNYTKHKVLPPPEKKKYAKDHLIMMIFIYHLKQTVSINDIQSLLGNLIRDGSQYDLEDVYSSFYDVAEFEYQNIIKDVEEKASLLKHDGTNSDSYYDDQLRLLVMSLIFQSSIQKMIAERIIDECFK